MAFLSSPSSRFQTSRNVFFIAVLSLVSLVSGAVDIHDYFRVATGNVLGTCDPYINDLSSYLDEAFAMMDSSRDTVATLRKKKGLYSDIRLFGMLFDIGLSGFTRGTAPVSDDDKFKLSLLQGSLDLMTSDTIKGINPRLYCDSKFLIWTDTAYDIESGEKTTTPLVNVLGAPSGNDILKGETSAYWFPDDHWYSFEKGASPTFQPCSGETGGFNIPFSNTLVLCPNLLDGTFGWKKSLAPFKDGSGIKVGTADADNNPLTAGDDIENFRSIPGAFLHEMAHMIKSSITDVEAYDENINPIPDALSYGFDRCTNLANAQPIKASLNADTYHYWGIGTYLSEVDWAHGFAMPLIGNIPPPDPTTPPPSSP